jgi:transposase
MLDPLAARQNDARRQRLDADWFPQALRERGIIPVKGQPQSTDPSRPRILRQRHKIENMFGRLKDWRPIHARYDRCAQACFSAICIATIVIF